jgi:hypothetical protein
MRSLPLLQEKKKMTLKQALIELSKSKELNRGKPEGKK